MARRVIGVVVAVVLAAVGTVVLVNYVRTAEERALAGEETVEVLVVQQPIDEGTPAEAIGERVVTERVPAKVRAAGGVNDLTQIEGRVAATELVPGEQVVTSRFVEPAVYEAQQAIEIPEGMQLVTIRVDQVRSVGGTIRPGHTVGLIGSFTGVEAEVEATDDEGQTVQVTEVVGDTTGFVVHKALVARVQTDVMPEDGDIPTFGQTSESDTAEGAGDEAQAAHAGARTVDNVPPGQFLITLAVEAADAEKVVFAAEYGGIWLTLEPDHAVEDGTRVQTRGTIYAR